MTPQFFIAFLVSVILVVAWLLWMAGNSVDDNAQAMLGDAKKVAGLPEDDRGFADAVGYVMFDHPLAMMTKQEAEALLNWLVWHDEQDGLHLAVKARDALVALAKEPAFDALRREMDRARCYFDQLAESPVAGVYFADPYEADAGAARLMARETGHKFYKMIRGA